ncbi:hypothetical protein [Terriglobus aquaticus]|uniref:Uncharacterized protein n=1 Tax=Terriglobus aquaticus TaxID=940139 RepID=A0ABW9KHS6_9BACT|nr:hypothetical protein [Terriglobus aquaticus]
MPRDFAQVSSQFLASIDAEIERLQSLRKQVATAVDADQAITKTAKTARRGMSEEGRRKIAEAQKARWAKQKKADNTATKASSRKTSLKQTAKKAATKKPSKKAAAAKTIEQA